MTRVIFLFLVIFVCSSCAKTVRISGHLFDQRELMALEKAKTKQDLEFVLGSPTSVSSFGPETWYYITCKKESFAFFKEKILEQIIYAVTFDENGKIEAVVKYTEKDMKNHEVSSEMTIVRGNDTSVAQRFFKNAGRFNKNKKEKPQLPRSGF